MQNESEPIFHSNDFRIIWGELQYLRKKVDSLETKLLYLFGTVTTVSTAIAIFEVLRKGVP